MDGHARRGSKRGGGIFPSKLSIICQLHIYPHLHSLNLSHSICDKKIGATDKKKSNEFQNKNQTFIFL